MQIIFRNTIKKPWNSKKPILVDWVSGTALLIKNKLFNDIGGFDEAFFMYFEDQDICLRVKSKNTKTLFYPDFKIVHHSGKSWKKQKNQKKYYYQSLDIFFKKHHNLIQQKLLTFFRKTIKGY
jgi:N-acetylglucosaminyl-diphospho-decaprenol L-rhamnosyltransferase